MVKIEKNPTIPLSLSTENGRTPTSYREKDVILQLKEDFHGKCYLCNMGDLTDINVEHLRPHRNDVSLKFDWNNLFYACPHCNSVKNKSAYDEIINCCQENPETLLAFLIQEDNSVSVTPSTGRVDVSATADLINDIFSNKNTGCRTIATEVRVRKLLEEMNLLYRILDEYHKGIKKVRNKKILDELLHRKSSFAAFKRSYVRENLNHYEELSECLS